MTDRDESIRLILIGPGPHAEEHLLPAILMTPGVRLVGISSRSAENAQRVAAKWAAEAWYADWREAVSRQKCNAVVVSATPQIHAEVLDFALQRNVHVFTEKPPAPDSMSLERLIDLERRSSSIAFVGFNLLFSAPVRRFLEFSIKYGGPRIVKIRCLANKPATPLWNCPDVVSSMLFAVGIHAISVLYRICPNVTYELSRLTEIRPNAISLIILFRGADGTRAEIELGNFANRFIFEMETTTSDGVTIALKGLRHFEMYRFWNGSEGDHPTISPKEVIGFNLDGLGGEPNIGGYVGEMNTFASNIREGTQSGSSLSASLKIYGAIDAVLRDIEPR